MVVTIPMTQLPQRCYDPNVPLETKVSDLIEFELQVPFLGFPYEENQMRTNLGIILQYTTRPPVRAAELMYDTLSTLLERPEAMANKEVFIEQLGQIQRGYRALVNDGYK